jgi:hypothetical protein
VLHTGVFHRFWNEVVGRRLESYEDAKDAFRADAAPQRDGAVEWSSRRRTTRRDVDRRRPRCHGLDLGRAERRCLRVPANGTGDLGAPLGRRIGGR